MFSDDCTATGCLVRHIPEGDELDELLGLVRLGVKMSAQHVGRRPGFLHLYLKNVFVGMHGEVTFERFIDRLENSILEPDSSIEIVNKKFLFIAYRHPEKGLQEATFKTLENYLSGFKNRPIPG